MLNQSKMWTLDYNFNQHHTKFDGRCRVHVLEKRHKDVELLTLCLNYMQKMQTACNVSSEWHPNIGFVWAFKFLMIIFDWVFLFWFCGELLFHSFSVVLLPYFSCPRKKFRHLESSILSISDRNNSRLWLCQTEAHQKTISLSQEQFCPKLIDFGRT